jgi:hypothetical protein
MTVSALFWVTVGRRPVLADITTAGEEWAPWTVLGRFVAFLLLRFWTAATIFNFHCCEIHSRCLGAAREPNNQTRGQYENKGPGFHSPKATTQI